MSDTESPETPQAVAEERKKIQLVFLGARLSIKKEKYWHWVELDEKTVNDGDKMGDDPSSRIYDGKPFLTGLRPGVIVEIDATVVGKSVFPATAKISGRWLNDADIQLWQTAHWATEAELETKQKAIKAINDNLPWEVLAPFRDAYLGAKNGRQRSLILGLIMYNITTYRKSSD